MAERRNPIIQWLIVACFGIALIGCASVGSLSGGPRDTRPPQLDSLNSTPLVVTNFSRREVTFEFDEFIQLKNPSAQILISPPLQYPYEAEVRNKTLRFRFDERDTLKSNTTYTINFGESIQDITEGNFQPLRFVFSTGPFVDSLVVTGTLLEAKGNKPVADALFFLYDAFDDSLVVQERPFYFGRTDKSGRFRIENVKAGQFKSFALQDANLDYLYQVNEPMGFAESDTITVDTNNTPILVRLSTADAPPAPPKVDVPFRGLAKLIFNSPFRAQSVEYDFLTTPPVYQEQRQADTVLLWLPPTDTNNYELAVVNGERIDTVKLKMSRAKQKEVVPQLAQQAKSVRGAGKGGTAIRSIDTISWTFNQPIQVVTPNQITLLKDSISVPFTYELTNTNRTLAIFPEEGFTPNSVYDLTVDSATLLGHLGNYNAQMVQTYRVQDPEKLGTLHLLFEDLDSTQSYVFRVFEGSNVFITAGQITEQSTAKITLPQLKPGVYEVEIVKDDNGNGRWDPGDYWTRRQPELIVRLQTEQLRANWELESILQPNFTPTTTAPESE